MKYNRGRDFRHAGFTGDFIYFLMSLRRRTFPFYIVWPAGACSAVLSLNWKFSDKSKMF